MVSPGISIEAAGTVLDCRGGGGESSERPQATHQSARPTPSRENVVGVIESMWQPNGWRLSCGALKKDSFLNLRAPSASSAC